MVHCELQDSHTVMAMTTQNNEDNKIHDTVQLTHLCSAKVQVCIDMVTWHGNPSIENRSVD